MSGTQAEAGTIQRKQNKTGASRRIVILTVFLLSGAVFGQTSRLSFNLQVDDPRGLLSPRLELFKQNLDAAVSAWGELIDSSAKLDMLVRVVPEGVGRMDGASASNIAIGRANGRTILQESAAYKLVTGKSADPSKPDLIIQINPPYLKNEVWLDPDPRLRTEPVPLDKLDGVSLLMHELFHAFGFNSFRDHQTGALPEGYAGVFDRWVRISGSRFYFMGPDATRIFAGPVPLTSTVPSQDISHYGNADDPALSLREGLMNGISFHRGHRYSIGPIDIAILQDLGIPLAK